MGENKIGYVGILGMLIISTLGLFQASALAASCDPTATPLFTYSMPLHGSWIVLDEAMVEGANDCFTGLGTGAVLPAAWEWTSSDSISFDITDLFTIVDRFEVYDFGTLVLTTPELPDWHELGLSGPYVDETTSYPPQTSNPDLAWAGGASAYYSQGSILFAPGSHSIRIRDIHIPPAACIPDPANPGQCLGGPTPSLDGTVAFRATVDGPTEIPEPISLVLF